METWDLARSGLVDVYVYQICGFIVSIYLNEWFREISGTIGESRDSVIELRS